MYKHFQRYQNYTTYTYTLMYVILFDHYSAMLIESECTSDVRYVYDGIEKGRRKKRKEKWNRHQF